MLSQLATSVGVSFRLRPAGFGERVTTRGTSTFSHPIRKSRVGIANAVEPKKITLKMFPSDLSNFSPVPAKALANLLC